MKSTDERRTTRGARRALGLTAIYAVLASAWIYASDALLGVFISDARLFALASTYKGWIFVAVTSALLYGVLLARPHATRLSPKAEVEFRIWPPIVIFAVFVMAVGATGVLIYRGIAHAVREHAADTLDAVADLKAQQVADWYADRHRNAQQISGSPFMAPEAEAWLERGAPEDASAQRFRNRLQTLVTAQRWSSVAVVDSEGRVRLDVGGAALDATGREAVIRAMRSRQVTVQDFHVRPDGRLAVTFFAPMIVMDERGQRAPSALVMEADPQHRLFNIVSKWPLTTGAGESVLVRREENSIVFVSDLRHQPSGPMSLRVPIDANEAAALALGSRRRPVEGRDHRGVAVLAASRTIPGTDWLLIATVDLININGPLADTGSLVSLFGLVLVLAAGLAVTFWLRQQRARAILRQYRAEREKTALTQRLDNLTRYANDIILLTDDEGVLLDANERALAAYGRTREELIGSNAALLRADEARDTFESEWTSGRSEEGIVFETIHRRADGTTFPVEVSSRAINFEGVVLRQSIIRDISERKEAELKLRESEEKYRLLFSNEQDAIVVFDAETTRIAEVNDAFLAMTGHTREGSTSLTVFDLTGEPESTQASLLTVRQRGWEKVRARRMKRRDGSEIWVELGLNSFMWRGRDLIVAIVRDISERKEAEERALLWANVLDNSAEGIVITDAERRILQVNKAFTAVTGYAPEEVLGRDPAILTSGRHDDVFFHVMSRTIRETGRWQGEVWNRRSNGDVYPSWVSITAVRNANGVLTHYLAVFSDISERKESAERIEFLANHDSLTGLANRSVMTDLIQQAVASARRKGTTLALLFLDLDRFKMINDSLGHPAGDELLREVSARLMASIREEDTVARLGGDEFLLLLPELARGRDAAVVAEKILAAVREPIVIEGRPLRVTASIGISVFPDDGNDVATLIKNADAAMYHAKERGRDNCQFFTFDMNARAFEALSMEMSLRGAVERDEFTLVYQPQVEAATGRIVGAEALIRWNHPELGLVLPSGFIPIAEEHGHIVQIGEWVLRTACLQVRRWLDAGVDAVPVGVNLSALHFRQAGLASRVRAILGEAGVDSRYLELEMTESIVMREAEQAIEVLEELSEMGVSLAIDDFGSGYSSLSYLRRFPIDRLKIDQSFVSEVTTSSDAAAIASAIIGMGRSMKLRVIAEGVETPEQLAFLTAERCDEVQGYHIARPMRADAFFALLREGRAMPARA